MATANTIISSGTFPEPAFREHVRQFDTNSDNILLGKNIDNSSIKGFDNKGEPVNLVSYNPDKRLAVFDAEPSIVVYSYNIGHEEDCFRPERLEQQPRHVRTETRYGLDTHQNIRAFGGDSENITVFGQSSSPAMVSLLAAMPEREVLVAMCGGTNTESGDVEPQVTVGASGGGFNSGCVMPMVFTVMFAAKRKI